MAIGDIVAGAATLRWFDHNREAADQRVGQSITVDGATIFCQDTGGSGTPLLLIQGFPLSGQLFHGQYSGLAGQFRVITPNLRGFGETARASIPNAQLGIIPVAEDAASTSSPATPTS